MSGYRCLTFSRAASETSSSSTRTDSVTSLEATSQISFSSFWSLKRFHTCFYLSSSADFNRNAAFPPYTSRSSWSKMKVINHCAGFWCLIGFLNTRCLSLQLDFPNRISLSHLYMKQHITTNHCPLVPCTVLPSGDLTLRRKINSLLFQAK